MPTFTTNETRLHYEDRGDGVPLVFLHRGSMGLRYFEPQLTALSDAYRTIALDFRDHGRSETPEPGQTIPQHAANVAALLDHLALEDVVLVGWGLSALVSWEYVDQFGTDRLRGLVDVDMAPTPVFPTEDNARDGPVALGEATATIQDEAGPSAADRTDGFMYPPLNDHRAPVDDETRTLASVVSAVLLELTCDYRDVLSAIDVPVLVYTRRAQRPHIRAVDEVVDHVPDARLKRFPESPSSPMLEESGAFTYALEAFVRSLETR